MYAFFKNLMHYGFLFLEITGEYLVSSESVQNNNILFDNTITCHHHVDRNFEMLETNCTFIFSIES